MATTNMCWPALLLLGCGTSITVTQINSVPHEMVARDAIEVFSSGPPARPHIDVAILEAQPSSSLSRDDNATVIAKLRAKAAHLGCDALVIGSGETGGTGRYLVHGYYATCIAYTDLVVQPRVATGHLVLDDAVHAPLVTEPIGFDPASDPGDDHD